MTTKTDAEQLRAEFEAWYRTEFSEDISDSTFIYYESCNRYQRPYIDRMWATYQAGRAALQSQDREDAEVTAYALPSGISVERSMQRDGSYLWAVRDGFKKCLSKNGEWDYEPFPSSRTDEWLAAHRFTSASEAIDHARRVEGEANG